MVIAPVSFSLPFFIAVSYMNLFQIPSFTHIIDYSNVQLFILSSKVYSTEAEYFRDF